MSDELITYVIGQLRGACWEEEAAAVEALVEERDIARRLLGAATQMQIETQAQLDKAVETIRELMYKYEYPQEQWKTRAVLVGLEGKEEATTGTAWRGRE